MSINLLPLELRRKPSRLSSVVLLVSLLGCLVIPPAYVAFKLSESNSALSEGNVMLNNEAKKYAKVEGLLSELKSLEESIVGMEKAVLSREVFQIVQLLDELSMLLPDGVTLVDVELNNESIIIWGEVPSYRSAAELLSAFAASDHFSAPMLRGLERVVDSFRFELTSLVNAGGESSEDK